MFCAVKFVEKPPSSTNTMGYSKIPALITYPSLGVRGHGGAGALRFLSGTSELHLSWTRGLIFHHSDTIRGNFGGRGRTSWRLPVDVPTSRTVVAVELN
jgi:hypothetical protein